LNTTKNPENAYHRGALRSILETIASELTRANAKLSLLMKEGDGLSPDEYVDRLVDIETCRIRLQEELAYAMRHLALIVPHQKNLQLPPTKST
jgi:hypothetical protein